MPLTMLERIAQAVYFFLPAYVANTLPGIFGGGTPVDFGKRFVDGRRLLGDGVTIRGTLAGIAGGTLVGALQGNLLLGFLLASGALAGDAAGSFIKRRLGLERGAPAPLLDQLNFVVGALVFASLITEIPADYIVVLFVITPFAHVTVNYLGYRLKVKDVPW
ncbi:CDP-2,3-bis-(O-geranylgeranyl)-sn-glycerol synthase [Candidatus Pyrohabitans sp.]